MSDVEEENPDCDAYCEHCQVTVTFLRATSSDVVCRWNLLYSEMNATGSARSSSRGSTGACRAAKCSRVPRAELPSSSPSSSSAGRMVA